MSGEGCDSDLEIRAELSASEGSEYVPNSDSEESGSEESGSEESDSGFRCLPTIFANAKALKCWNTALKDAVVKCKPAAAAPLPVSSRAATPPSLTPLKTSDPPTPLPGSSSSSCKLFVHIAKKNNGKRVYDKKSKCKFCDVLTTNLRKHLLSKRHRNEPEIALILSKPKHSKEREFLLEKVRNQGNYQHNFSVLKEQKGEIIPWRSPSEKVNPNDYIPCEFCFGFFVRTELWRHQQCCKFRSTAKKGRFVISRSESLLPASIDCEDGLKKDIFESMRADGVTFVARRDALIIKFGEKLYHKHGHKEYKRVFIKQKLRELARLLLALREQDESVTDLRSVIHASKFLRVVSAVKKLCGHNPSENTYSNPSLALKLGHSLKRCCSILKSQGLMQGDEKLQKMSTDFRDLCEVEWKDHISSGALSTLEEKKINKPHVLPLTKDLKILTEYLEAERISRLSELKSRPTTDRWLALAKVCLANIIMFNRRRSGEAARMLITDYEVAQNNTVAEDDILNALSEMERMLIDNFTRVEIRGKRGGIVPVLLTKSMQGEINQLLHFREQAGIHPDNVYIFARPYFSSLDHLAGHTCLRETVIKSGVERPQDITSTKLRKHLATVSQILNLNEYELDQLCGFMGHNIRVHREFYRIPRDSYQLAKVSRLLMAAECGQIARFEGKSLDEIELDEELEFHDSEFEDGEVHGGDNENDMEELGDDERDLEERDDCVEPDCNMSTVSPAAEPVFATSNSCTKKSRKDEIVTKYASPKSRNDRISTKKGGAGKKSLQNKDFMTSDQMKAVKKHFKAHIESLQVPRKAECEGVLKNEPLLAGRSWLKIKCTVRNEIEKRKREVKRLKKR